MYIVIPIVVSSTGVDVVGDRGTFPPKFWEGIISPPPKGLSRFPTMEMFIEYSK